MIVTDTNKDGKDDIILSTSWCDKGLLFGFNYLGAQILSNTTSDNIPSASYRMNLLSDINFKDTNNDFIYGLFANDIIIYNANGSNNSILEKRLFELICYMVVYQQYSFVFYVKDSY